MHLKFQPPDFRGGPGKMGEPLPHPTDHCLAPMLPRATSLCGSNNPERFGSENVTDKTVYNETIRIHQSNREDSGLKRLLSSELKILDPHSAAAPQLVVARFLSLTAGCGSKSASGSIGTLHCTSHEPTTRSRDLACACDVIQPNLPRALRP